jgi:hypothetical protein
MKTYITKTMEGYWLDDNVYVDEGATARLLPLRLDLYNHSPTGFAWGYSGSGPAQLALAILADLMGDALALRYYMRFKFDVISGLDQNKGFAISSDEIEAWLKKVGREEQERKDPGHFGTGLWPAGNPEDPE